jgi:hypothetical protein
MLVTLLIRNLLCKFLNGTDNHISCGYQYSNMNKVIICICVRITYNLKILDESCVI